MCRGIFNNGGEYKHYLWINPNRGYKFHPLTLPWSPNVLYEGGIHKLWVDKVMHKKPKYQSSFLLLSLYVIKWSYIANSPPPFKLSTWFMDVPFDLRRENQSITIIETVRKTKKTDPNSIQRRDVGHVRVASLRLRFIFLRADSWILYENSLNF